MQEPAAAFLWGALKNPRDDDSPFSSRAHLLSTIALFSGTPWSNQAGERSLAEGMHARVAGLVSPQIAHKWKATRLLIR
jgi:hypothetical protein